MNTNYTTINKHYEMDVTEILNKSYKDMDEEEKKIFDLTMFLNNCPRCTFSEIERFIDLGILDIRNAKMPYTGEDCVELVIGSGKSQVTMKTTPFIDCNNLSNEKKAKFLYDVSCQSNWYNYIYDTRKIYNKRLAYEDLIDTIKSCPIFTENDFGIIEQMSDKNKLAKIIKKYTDVCYYTKMSDVEKGKRHQSINFYPPTKENEEMIAAIKKAYENGTITLALDGDGIVGFTIKDFKNEETNEIYNDVFSIDAFRYEDDIPQSLYEINDIAYVKKHLSKKKLAKFIYESMDVCFDEVRDAFIEKIKKEFM